MWLVIDREVGAVRNLLQLAVRGRGAGGAMGGPSLAGQEAMKQSPARLGSPWDPVGFPAQAGRTWTATGIPHEAGFVGCLATGQLVAMGRKLTHAH
jgi:hypothetical protein